MTDLPKGWARIALADLGSWKGGGTPSKTRPDFWGGAIPWVSPKDMKADKIKATGDGITPEAVAGSATSLIPAGSILIVTRSGILAHTFPVAINAIDVTVNQDLKALIPLAGLSPDYIRLVLKGHERQILDACVKDGTTVHSIELPTLMGFEIPLPPLPEQHRIVVKIEALFSELDAGQDSLTRAQAQLKLYRQSLLKAAFQGRLTADWRAANPDKLESPETLLSRIRTERDARYKQALDDWQQALTDWRTGGEVGRKPGKPSRPEVSGNPDIPEDLQEICGTEWPWLRLGDIAEVSGGLTKNQKRNTLPRKMKYLRVGNVYADRLDLDEISEIGVSEDEWESNRLAQGDLLIVEGNGSVDQIGRVAIWDGSIDRIGHQNHLIRVRFLDGQLARFFLSFLMSPLGRDLIVRQASSTSGLHTLSISKVSALPVPVPTPIEQARLLEAVAAPLSLVDHQMGEITTALAKITALRQSILKQAFSGRLVPQDPADEPASALLARLRASAPPARAKRKTQA